jgi:hypothetical protein
MVSPMAAIVKNVEIVQGTIRLTVSDGNLDYTIGLTCRDPQDINQGAAALESAIGDTVERAGQKQL